MNKPFTKINPTGSALVYSTYLGGSGGAVGSGIAVDGFGNAYVTGSTSSTDFPTTAGAFQTTIGGDDDAFVTKLNPTGSVLVYSTYLGGSSFDAGNGIAVDASGNAYVTGSTSSTDFPTVNALQSTYGPGQSDVFVTKLNPAGTALIFSTYLGGSFILDAGIGIAVDASGNAYVTGYTGSTIFPTTSGAFQTTYAGEGDVFISKIGFGLPFSCFTCRLELRRDEEDFDLDATFTLGPGGSINPPTEPVSLSIGTYSVTIPAGSFMEHDGGYRFEGVINGVRLEVLVKHRRCNGSEDHSDVELAQDSGSARCACEADSYKFLAKGTDANLKGITNPVTVTISVGVNSGATKIKAKLEQPWVGY